MDRGTLRTVAATAWLVTSACVVASDGEDVAGHVAVQRQALGRPSDPGSDPGPPQGLPGPVPVDPGSAGLECPLAPPSCGTGCSVTGVQSLSAATNASYLALWPDGKVHTGSHIVDPDMGTSEPFPYYGFVARPSISAGGATPLVFSHYSALQAHTQDGTIVYTVNNNGCCTYDYVTLPVVVSASGYGFDRGHGGSGFYGFQLDDGTLDEFLYTPTANLTLHLSADEQLAWVTGPGVVGVADFPSLTVLETAPWAGLTISPGAVAADGAFIAAVPGQEVLRFQEGDLTTPDWQVSLSLEGGPIISAGGKVVVASSDAPRVRAYDVTTGQLAWEAPEPGPVSDLLVGAQDLGGGEVVWVLSATEGTVYGLSEEDGSLLYRYTDVIAGDEMVLRDCTLYVNGGGQVIGFDVPSPHYDPAAPWPVRFHDNQRTMSGATPLDL